MKWLGPERLSWAWHLGVSMILAGLLGQAQAQALQCTVNGSPAAIPLLEHDGRLHCVFAATSLTERIIIRSAEQEAFRVSYTPSGQLRELVCNGRTLAPEETSLCGWTRPVTVELVDEANRVRAQLTHDQGRRVAYKVFDALGALRSSEQRLESGRTELVRYRAGGAGTTPVIHERFELDPRTGRRVVHELFHDNGQPSQRTTWDDAGMAIETQWNLHGQITERRHATRFEGKSANEVLRYWPNGLIRSRGLVDASGRELGLHQEFDERGRLVRELIAQDGRLLETWRALAPSR
jgi:hypothetical protein